MFLLISFGQRGKPKKPAQGKKGRKALVGAGKEAKGGKLKEQLRRAMARFRGKRDYNGFLLYMNKVAVVATLESIGVRKARKNKRLIGQVVAVATSDFKNLLDTGSKLTPKYKVELFEVLGPKLAKEFLEKIPSARAKVFLIEAELVREENKRDLKDK